MKRVILIAGILFLSGCCRNPYYCHSFGKKTFTATAILVDGPPYIDATGYHETAPLPPDISSKKP